MEYLEKTQSWKEEEFDVVLQFMRTILLRRMSLLPSSESQANTNARWRIPYLHDTIYAVTTTHSYSFQSRNPFPLEKASSKTQRDRPR